MLTATQRTIARIKARQVAPAVRLTEAEMANKRRRQSRRTSTARRVADTGVQHGWRGRLDRIGGWPLVSSVAVAVVVVVVLVALNRPAPDSSGATYVPIAHPTANGRIEGQNDAPVRIEIFADFQCPHCGSFFRETEPALRAEFVESGNATVQFHDYPFLGMESVRASEAAACAERQGFFWEYHDILFQKQPADGRENVGVYTDNRLKQYAGEVREAWADERDFDTAAFNACFDAHETANQIAESTQEARSLGVSSTPTFLVNGKMLVGAQTIEAFRQAIEEARGG